MAGGSRRTVPSFQLYAVISVFLASAACGGKEVAVTEEPARYPVSKPRVRDAVIERSYVADVRAARYAELRTRVKGVVEAVAVDEGQKVRAGQTLFTINARALKQELLVARAALLGAEAELEAANLELQNTQLLQTKNVVSAAELALAKSKVQMLKAKVEEAKATSERAKAELGFAEIKAPFDGVINRIPRRVGSAVAEDELLTTIADTSEVFAYFRVSERETLDNAAAPDVIKLQLANGDAFPTLGKIDAIENEIDRETGTLAYRARFANPGGTLKHGSSGKITLTSTLRDAVHVLQKSTFDVQGNIYTYVVDAANVTHARKLDVLARVGQTFVVGGIQPTERLVREGVQKIKDGSRIEIAAPTTAQGDDF